MCQHGVLPHGGQGSWEMCSWESPGLMGSVGPGILGVKAINGCPGM